MLYGQTTVFIGTTFLDNQNFQTNLQDLSIFNSSNLSMTKDYSFESSLNLEAASVIPGNQQKEQFNNWPANSNSEANLPTFTVQPSAEDSGRMVPSSFNDNDSLSYAQNVNCQYQSVPIHGQNACLSLFQSNKNPVTFANLGC